jgi:hypothetical protein
VSSAGFGKYGFIWEERMFPIVHEAGKWQVGNKLFFMS